jgi:hypothetical protein
MDPTIAGFFAGKEKIEGRGTYLGFGSGSA